MRILCLTFMFTALFIINSYAEELKFESLEGYGGFSKKACSYVTEDGTRGNTALESTLCVDVYRAYTTDIEKAYTEYLKSYLYKFPLPEKPPVNRKNKDKIHVRLIYNGVDYNVLFVKKDDAVYVYDHAELILVKQLIGELKPTYETDKLKFYKTRSIYVGENLRNTVSNVVIKKVYNLSDNTEYHKYEVNTSDIDEAFKIINEFRNNTFGRNYQVSLKDNNNTEYISDSFVTTDYDYHDIGVYTLELKKQGNKVIGTVEIRL